jgi:hypothetical protein
MSLAKHAIQWIQFRNGKFNFTGCVGAVTDLCKCALQLRSRKLATWVDGSVHVGGLHKLYGLDRKRYYCHDNSQFFHGHKPCKRKICLQRNVFLHKMCLGSSFGACRKYNIHIYAYQNHFYAPIISVTASIQDLCVGDLWETQERRGISSFTTAIAVDKFQLVTLAKSEPDTMFVVPQRVRAFR